MLLITVGAVLLGCVESINQKNAELESTINLRGTSLQEEVAEIFDYKDDEVTSERSDAKPVQDTPIATISIQYEKLYYKTSDLYFNTWGGSKAKNNIKLHSGGSEYVDTHENSQYVLYRDTSDTKFDTGEDKYVYMICAKDVDLCLHAYGSTKKGTAIKLYGNLAYAKTKDTSKFWFKNRVGYNGEVDDYRGDNFVKYEDGLRAVICLKATQKKNFGRWTQCLRVKPGFLSSPGNGDQIIFDSVIFNSGIIWSQVMSTLYRFRLHKQG